MKDTVKTAGNKWIAKREGSEFAKGYRDYNGTYVCTEMYYLRSGWQPLSAPIRCPSLGALISWLGDQRSS